MFGVFDGHGGPEVAEYSKRNMHRILRKALEETNNDYKDALRRAFLDVDENLVKNGGLEDVAKWRKEKP